MTIISPLEEKTVKEGSDVTLECEASKPNVESTWFKDDAEIVPNDKYDMTVDDTIHSLTVHDTVPEDAGEYTVELGIDASTTHVNVEGRSPWLLAWSPWQHKP